MTGIQYLIRKKIVEKLSYSTERFVKQILEIGSFELTKYLFQKGFNKGVELWKYMRFAAKKKLQWSIKSFIEIQPKLINNLSNLNISNFCYTREACIPCEFNKWMIWAGTHYLDRNVELRFDYLKYKSEQKRQKKLIEIIRKRNDDYNGVNHSFLLKNSKIGQQYSKLIHQDIIEMLVDLKQ